MTRNPATNLTIVLSAAVLLLAGLTWLNFRLPAGELARDGFTQYWTAANRWLTEGISPYDPGVRRSAEEAMYGRAAAPAFGETTGHFLTPMYAMLVYGPLGLIELPFARALWMTLLEIALLTAAFLGLQVVDWRPSPVLTAAVLLFSVLGYHAGLSVLSGQLTGLAVLFLVLSLYWIRQRQDTAAGVVLAFMTISPQAAVLVVPFICIWAYAARRRGVLAGFALTWGALLVVALLLVPSWPMQFVSAVLDYQARAEITSPLSVLAGYAPGIETLLIRLLHTLAVLYLIVQWALAWKKDERWLVWTALMSLVITRLILPAETSAGHVLVLPALLLPLRVLVQRWGSAGALVTVLVLAALSAGLWALRLRGNGAEGAALVLVTPLLGLASLWWTRWWAVRKPRLLLEEVAERFG